jgi:hypothetical protein
VEFRAVPLYGGYQLIINQQQPLNMPEDTKIILTDAWLNHGRSSRTVSAYTVGIYNI